MTLIVLDSIIKLLWCMEPKVLKRAKDLLSMQTTLQSEDQLTLIFLTKYPIEGARLLESFTPQTTTTLLSSFPPQLIAHVFQYMLPHSTLAILQLMSEQTVTDILSHMTPSSAVRTLHFADRTWRAGLLAKMNLCKSASVLKAFSFKEGSAGRFANPHVPILTGDRTVSDAIQWIQAHQGHMTDELYVVDHQHRLLGSVSMRGLLIADLDDILKEVATAALQTLSANWSLEEIYNCPLWFTHHTLPVIDTSKTFLGIISYSSLLSIQKLNYRTDPHTTEIPARSQATLTSSNNGKTLPHFMTPVPPFLLRPCT